MRLERLRLAGFKSFVEPVELAIAPGLTGIVGPNGCGKSNLVEAVRWVMGEVSARRLRGGDMEDVIFNGSAARPPRNLAEVAMTLDNGDRGAPFAFNDAATIEITRRIVRGSGSDYRINGREARSRDVQLLFADAASGPNSCTLVGQGRVAALIADPPAQRRMLLDEAAGTAGLHARRREAELKLRAAEDNLARLDDVVAALVAQIETLKKQARQAQRYRRLGEQIRRCETLLLYARWRRAAAAGESFAAGLREAVRELAAASETALAAERRRGCAEAALPGLRAAQADAGAARQRLAHAREGLQHELNRIAAARGEADQRQSQVTADIEREAGHIADAEAALARLASERRELDAAAAAGEHERTAAVQQLDETATALTSAETGLQQMTEACATGDARHAALDRQRRDLGERRGRLAARVADSQRQQAAALAAIVPPEALAVAAAAAAAAAEEAEAARTAAATAGDTLAAGRRREEEAVDGARTAERALERLKAEADALSRLLAADEAVPADAAPAWAQLKVPPGLEAATAALFDGELAVPLLDAAAADAAENGDADAEGWREMAPLVAPPLPEGVRPIAGDIAAPAALLRRIGHAGWVADPTDGWRLQKLLAAGQSLVDCNGRLWRWDGFVRSSMGAASATAERLRQRNRRDRLAEEIALASPEAEGAGAHAAAARTAREAAATAERAAIAALRAAEERLNRERNAEVEISRRGLAVETRLAAVTDAIEQQCAERAEIDQQAGEIERSLALLPDPGLTRRALEAARAEAAAARRRDSDARALLDRLTREAASRAQRLASIATEEAAWCRRRDGALAQRAVLVERQTALAVEIAELAARPAAVESDIAALAQAAAAAAARLQDAEDALAGGETAFRTANEAARRADTEVAAARERRAGLQARREAADEALLRLREEIADRLAVTPEALAALAGEAGAPQHDGGGSDGEADDLAVRFDRLVRERDAIGPVNLLAEQEAVEVDAQLHALQSERTDLTQAISRLRRGIATLDQEARARVTAAFDALNGHFGELFARLFGGGKAALAWTDGDDPLDAGLDILASPPGKRLGRLTLLSGGEQALTALALIFAVFLTNPSPLCVLDEVDAPLDDANVSAFCRLVADIADATGTRFLVVTHHRVTMARMDRLYGVTMAERGVSQLVSVDLARAVELRQTA